MAAWATLGCLAVLPAPGPGFRGRLWATLGRFWATFGAGLEPLNGATAARAGNRRLMLLLVVPLVCVRAGTCAEVNVSTFTSSRLGPVSLRFFRYGATAPGRRYV